MPTFPEIEKMVKELMDACANHGATGSGNSKKKAEKIRDKLVLAICSETETTVPVIKHEGESSGRIIRETKEKAFADVWAEQAPTTLPYLLDGQDRRTHMVTQNDATVAATVIQWLGSNVGQSFLEDVKDRIERYKTDKLNREKEEQA
jgi:hypothetical protein